MHLSEIKAGVIGVGFRLALIFFFVVMPRYSFASAAINFGSEAS